jgi:hypothetical protein
VPPRTSYQPISQEPGNPNDPVATLPEGTIIPTPQAKAKVIRYAPRYSGTRFDQDSIRLPDGTRRSIFTGGVIVNVTFENSVDEIEFATDEAVIWARGLAIDNPPKEGLQTTGNGKEMIEVYLTGNVIVRMKSRTGPPQILRAASVYYDLDRDRAIALRGDLEYAPLLAPDPIHLRGEELRRLDLDNWEALKGTANSSKLPNDPGIRMDARRMVLHEEQGPLRNVFGLQYRDLLTGKPVVGEERTATMYDAVPRVGGVPVFYFPWFRTDADRPLGPFLNAGFGQSTIFGTQLYTTWDMFNLLAIRPPSNQRWALELDYLSARGPAIGSNYTYQIPPSDPFSGISPALGLMKYYGIWDHGQDILGGERGVQPTPPDFRQRFLWRHQQEITPDLYFQGQLAYQSDQNYLEEYFKTEYDTGPNQELFAYLTWQRDNWWTSALAEDRLARPWMDETNWLPRFDGGLLGQSFLDRFVYMARGSAAFAQSRPSQSNPYPVLSTDQRLSTGRLDLNQELSVPFGLGPVQFAPYGMLDLTGYSNDLNGNPIGRVWGGGGTRASISLSRLYEGVASDLFNIRDLYHKAVLSLNYLNAQTNVHYNQLPLLDRLNDDATDQAWRNIKPYESQLVSGLGGIALQNSPVYDPQLYAIRRVLLNKVDTMDAIDVLQLDLRQRLQTHRGYPGMEHVVDVMTLSTSASYFPQAQRDNFGHPWSFLEYEYLWNIGDRVSAQSTGWFEPYTGGSRYWTVGLAMNRPDRTNFYVGYRQIDPVNSKAVTLALGYQLSNRYYLNVSSAYDFGIHAALSNALMLTRTGTDLTVSIGVSYNSLQNNFSLNFMMMPNFLMGATAQQGGMGMMGMQGGMNQSR